MKILTTNWHVPYIFNLAKLKQYEFYVISFRHQLAGRDWYLGYRNFPANVHHIAIDSAKYLELLKYVDFNLIIMHNVFDIDVFAQAKLIPIIPSLFVFHNSFFTEFRTYPPDQWPQQRQLVQQKLSQFNIQPVFISEFKRNSYEINGTIITPGIDTTTEFPYTYNGIELIILRICSNLKQRDFMNGYLESNDLCGDYPNILLGEGNLLSDYSKNTKLGMTNNLDQLRITYQICRLFLSTNIDKFEDSYNLSSLESASIGMPIVAFHHERSIWKDGVHGFVSDNKDYLKYQIKNLLQDRQLAVELGKNARKLVEEQFSISKFLTTWDDVITYSGKEIKQQKVLQFPVKSL